MRTETFLNPFATTFNQVRQRLIRWQHHPTGIINQRCLPGEPGPGAFPPPGTAVR